MQCREGRIGGSRGAGGRVPAYPGGEGSRPKRGGRKGVVAQRGEKGLGY